MEEAQLINFQPPTTPLTKEQHNTNKFNANNQRQHKDKHRPKQTLTRHPSPNRKYVLKNKKQYKIKKEQVNNTGKGPTEALSVTVSPFTFTCEIYNIRTHETLNAFEIVDGL